MKGTAVAAVSALCALLVHPADGGGLLADRRRASTLDSPLAKPTTACLTSGPLGRCPQSQRAATRLVLEMPVMRECLDVPGNAIRFRNMSVGMVGKADFVLNGFFDVTRPVRDIAEIVVVLTKCRDHVSGNTCEHFQTWRFSRNVCRLMYGGNTMWSSFQKYVTPRPSCPSKPGTYTIRNATIDMKLVQTVPLPLEGNVWLVRYFMNEAKGKVHVCTDTELVVHRVRDV